MNTHIYMYVRYISDVSRRALIYHVDRCRQTDSRLCLDNPHGLLLLACRAQVSRRSLAPLVENSGRKRGRGKTES